MSIRPTQPTTARAPEAPYDAAFVGELTRRVLREHELAARHRQIFRELTAARAHRSGHPANPWPEARITEVD